MYYIYLRRDDLAQNFTATSNLFSQKSRREFKNHKINRSLRKRQYKKKRIEKLTTAAAVSSQLVSMPRTTRSCLAAEFGDMEKRADKELRGEKVRRNEVEVRSGLREVRERGSEGGFGW